MSTDALHSSPLYHESSTFVITQTSNSLPQNGTFNPNTDSVSRSITSPAAYNCYQSQGQDEYSTTTFGQSPKHYTPPSPRGGLSGPPTTPPQPQPRRVKNTNSQPELKNVPTSSGGVQQSEPESPKPLPRKLKSAVTQPQLTGSHATTEHPPGTRNGGPPQPLPRRQVPQSPGANSSPTHMVLSSPPARQMPASSLNHTSHFSISMSDSSASAAQSSETQAHNNIPSTSPPQPTKSPIETAPPIVPARVPSVPYTSPKSPGDSTQSPIPKSPARFSHQLSNSPTHQLIPASPPVSISSNSPTNSPPLSRGIERQPQPPYAYNRMSSASPTLLLQPSSPPPTNIRQHSLPTGLQARDSDSRKNSTGAANKSVGGASVGSHRLSAPPFDCPMVSITSEEESMSGESGHTTPDQSHSKRYSRTSQSSDYRQSADITKLSAYLSPSHARKGSHERAESPPLTRFSGYDIMELFTAGNILMFVPQGDPHKSPIKVDGGKLKGGGSFLSTDSMFEIIIPRQSLDRIIMFRNCSHKNDFIAINKKGKIGIHHGKAGKCEFNVRLQEQFTSPVVCLESAQFPGWYLAMTSKGTPGDPMSVGTTLESQFIVRGHKLANSHFNSSPTHMVSKRSPICRLQDRCVIQLCSKVSSKYLGIDKKGRMLETEEKDPLSYFVVYDRGLGVISLQSYKNGSHWLRIQNLEIQGKGRPDLNSDLIIRENIDASVCLESVVSPGSYIACYSGVDASDPSMVTKARNFALGFVQNVKIK